MDAVTQSSDVRCRTKCCTEPRHNIVFASRAPPNPALHLPAARSDMLDDPAAGNFEPYPPIKALARRDAQAYFRRIGSPKETEEAEEEIETQIPQISAECSLRSSP
jgi:hypothetical protein